MGYRLEQSTDEDLSNYGSLECIVRHTGISPIPTIVKAVAKDFKDSGERQNFQTGAVRDTSTGKGRFDLMPPIPLFLVSKIYETGCLKYGDRNWEKGIPISRYLDSAQRHILKYQAGMRDEPHLSMATWNCLCALWTASMVVLKLRPKELYDLPNHVNHDIVGPLSDFEMKGIETFIGSKLNDPEKSDLDRTDH